MFDIVFLFGGLAAFFPFLAVVSLLIKIDSYESVFFFQNKMDRNNKKMGFRCGRLDI
ncbi:MAG: sugar transferase [Flavobacteriaceae bacterium]|nr:sugar transferase [Flavobacteriaceae bacterium]